MAKGIRFADGLQVVPLLAPAATTADAESAFVKCKNLQWLSFIISVGNLSGSATATWNIAIKSTTSSGGSTAAGDYALPFTYRSATLGTDNWGDATAVTTATGYVQFTGGEGDVNILIDVNPADIASHDSDATEVYVDIDHTGDGATDSCYMSIVGVFEPRYPQAENLSSS